MKNPSGHNKAKMAFEKATLLQSGKLNYSAQVQLTNGKSARGGYVNALARLQRKTPKQLRNNPGTGPFLKDLPWL